MKAVPVIADPLLEEAAIQVRELQRTVVELRAELERAQEHCDDLVRKARLEAEREATQMRDAIVKLREALEQAHAEKDLILRSSETSLA